MATGRWAFRVEYSASTPTGTVLESYGATALNQVDNRYYLYDSNGSGPL
jgi:hypothetical protein